MLLTRTLTALPNVCCANAAAQYFAAALGLTSPVPALSETRRHVRHLPRYALSSPAAPRHRRLSAHDRSAVRWPREVGARARRRDEGRQADPSRYSEKRRPG